MKRIFFSFFLFTMVSIVIWQYAFSPAVEWMVEEYFYHELNQYYRSLVQGVYNMLIEDIGDLPEDRWAEYIERRQPQFGYRLAIEPVDSLNLTAEELELLEAGGIVVKQDGDLYYRRLGASDRVVTMGPLQEFEMPLRIEALIWTTIVVSFGLMALGWALPFWLKLRRISMAAEAFGRGDFSARARLPERSALSPLALSFNDMAGRIQQLIASHKELTRAVSHELRTPISRIRFSIEMLETAEDATERRQSVSEINKDVDELDTLVTELLIYARFDRETPTLNPIELPVSPWLADIAKKAGKSFHHAELRYFIPPENRENRVSFDPRYMSRALDNLIQNAMKYANSLVELRFEEADGSYTIHVDDDGPGIPEADRKRIFKPFVRLDSSRSRDTGGYGLGLAIVRQIVDWHGGEVHVGKSPLGGARFSVRWRGDC